MLIGAMKYYLAPDSALHAAANSIMLKLVH